MLLFSFDVERRKKENTPDKDGTFLHIPFCFSSLSIFVDITVWRGFRFGLMIPDVRLLVMTRLLFSRYAHAAVFLSGMVGCNEKCLDTVQLMRNEIYTSTILTVQSTTHDCPYNITLLIDACTYTIKHIHTAVAINAV